jgi:hypothetical protein
MDVAICGRIVEELCPHQAGPESVDPQEDVMNANTRVMLLGLALAGAALLAGPQTLAAEPRTKEQCTTLFHELNTSGDGKLTIQEAAKNSDLMTTLSAPSLWKKGYMTEEEFTPLCATEGPAGPRN